MNHHDEWSQTKDVIVGLYPKWSLTTQQASVFRDEFMPLRQDVLREAVKRLWVEDKFGAGSLNNGKLKAMYTRVRQEKEAAFNERDDEHEDEVDWKDVKEDHEAILRRVLLSDVNSVMAAADRIRNGFGRWGYMRPQMCEGSNPSNWSAMMQSAVLYEMENPSVPDGVVKDDTLPSEVFDKERREPEAGGLDFLDGSPTDVVD